MLGEE